VPVTAQAAGAGLFPHTVLPVLPLLLPLSLAPLPAPLPLEPALPLDAEPEPALPLDPEPFALPLPSALPLDPLLPVEPPLVPESPSEGWPVAEVPHPKSVATIQVASPMEPSRRSLKLAREKRCPTSMNRDGVAVVFVANVLGKCPRCG
jgi:hypothetical protein